MLQITPSLAIPDEELIFTFVRASGPGGQNINKVATAVQLYFDVENSPSLSDETKTRLTRLAGKRLTSDGVLVIVARRFRTQEQNRLDAQQRLVTLIQKALAKPKKRYPTKPSQASRTARVDSKKRHGAIKLLRRTSPDRDG